MFKYIISLSAIFILAITFTSCSDGPVATGTLQTQVDTSSFTFPYEIGTIWTYDRVFSAENIRPDSIRHYFTNWPIRGKGEITILYDTVINGITARCFFEEYTEFHPTDTNTWYNRFYYVNTDTALLCIASRVSTGIFSIPYRPAVENNAGFRMGDMNFKNPLELTAFIEQGGNRGGRLDSFVIENPPVISLKYPIVIGTEWVSKYIQGQPWSYKKYLSFTLLNVLGAQITCIKTERRIPLFNNSFLYDYYSKNGQVKRDYLFKDMSFTTKTMPTGAGFVDIRDVYNVTSISITTP